MVDHSCLQEDFLLRFHGSRARDLEAICFHAFVPEFETTFAPFPATKTKRTVAYLPAGVVNGSS